MIRNWISARIWPNRRGAAGGEPLITLGLYWVRVDCKNKVLTYHIFFKGVAFSGIVLCFFSSRSALVIP